jgi:hypothetical protein
MSMPSQHNRVTQRKEFALNAPPIGYSAARSKEKNLRRREKFIESLANVIFRHENFLKSGSRHSEKKCIGS